MGTTSSVRVLGPLAVTTADGPVAIGGRKQRTVLAVLLLARGSSVPVDRLIDEVWGGDPPPSAAGTMHACVSRLRRVLGAYLRRDDQGYRFEIDDDSIDLRRFEILVAEGDCAVSRLDDRSGADAYGRALAEWSGDTLLGELGFERFAEADAARALALRLHATVQRFDALLRCDEAAVLLPQLESAIARDSYVETLWAQLILAQYRSGRQVEALRTFRRAARLLRDEAGVEPGQDLCDLERRILGQDPGLAAQAIALDRRDMVSVPTNLRATSTTLVGRDADLEAAIGAVGRHRLVTLLGPGGVGKTRLAVDVAWELVDRHPEGVWDVDLTVARDDCDVVPAVAEALDLSVPSGTRGMHRLVHQLRPGATLLLLDNCEHVIDGASELVTHLLAHLPDLRMLATSRIALGVNGEHRRTVHPLPTDGIESAAVALFLQRARHVARTARNDDNIVRIVHRLEGLPLAVELAAAATALLTPNQLADQLDHRTSMLFDASTDDVRHRTLRGTVEWSYDLLDDDWKVLLMRLSVFPAPFTSADAADVCGGEPLDASAIPVALEALAGRSLLVALPSPDSSADRRWRLFESVREYAADRTDAAGWAESLRSRHAAHYAAMASRLALDFHGPHEARALRELRTEHTHLTAMLRHLEGRQSDGPMFAAAVHDLWYWWYLDGRVDEAAHWIAAGVAVTPDGALLPQLLAASALVASQSGDPGWAEHAHEVGLRALDQVPPADRDLLATVQLLVGDSLSATDDHLADAERLLLASRDHFIGRGSSGRAGWAELRLVRIDGFLRADLERGQSRLDDAVALLDQAGDLQLLAYAQMVRSNMARLHGEVAVGLDLASEATRLYREFGSPAPLATAIEIQISLLIDAGRIGAAEATLAVLEQLVTTHRLPSWSPVLELDRARCLGHRGEHARALTVLEGELDDRRAARDVVGVQSILWCLALLVALTGDADRAIDLMAEGAALSEATSSPWNRLSVGRGAADVQLVLGRTDDAEATLHTLFADARRLGQRVVLAESLEGLAVVQQAHARADDCIALLGAARRVRDDCGSQASARQVERTAAAAAWCRTRWSPQEFARRWQEGAHQGLGIEP